MALKLRVPVKLVVEEFDQNRQITRAEYIELPGRNPVDFAVSDGQNVILLMEFVRQTFGEWRGMYIADTFGFSYGDRTVTAREPTTEELGRSFRKLPRFGIPFQLQVPASILQKSEQDAVLILQSGAVANALQTVLLSSRPPETTMPLVSKRDLIHRSIIVASYVHEARRVIYGDKSHKGRLWELATIGVRSRQHVPIEVIEECKRLLDDRGPLADQLYQLRNFVGFHLLPPEFRKWLRQRSPDEKLLLISTPDPTRPDVVFVASAQAIADAYSDEKAGEFLALAEGLARALPYVIEAAIYGVIHEQGLDSRHLTAFDLKSFAEAVEASSKNSG